MAILNITSLIKVAGESECPACRINEELKACGRAGALAKATTIRKSKSIRAIYRHTHEV